MQCKPWLGELVIRIPGRRILLLLVRYDANAVCLELVLRIHCKHVFFETCDWDAMHNARLLKLVLRTQCKSNVKHMLQAIWGLQAGAKHIIYTYAYFGVVYTADRGEGES